ncbi:MAG: hypothetical protein WC683_15760 [bacterium]
MQPVPRILARLVCDRCGVWHRITLEQGSDLKAGSKMWAPCSDCQTRTVHRICSDRSTPAEVS